MKRNIYKQYKVAWVDHKLQLVYEPYIKHLGWGGGKQGVP